MRTIAGILILAGAYLLFREIKKDYDKNMHVGEQKLSPPPIVTVPLPPPPPPAQPVLVDNDGKLEIETEYGVNMDMAQ